MAEIFSRIRDLTVGLDSKRKELEEINSNIQENEREILEMVTRLKAIKSEDIISFPHYSEARKDLEGCQKRELALTVQRSQTTKDLSIKLKEIQSFKERYEEISTNLTPRGVVLEFKKGQDATANPDVGI